MGTHVAARQAETVVMRPVIFTEPDVVAGVGDCA
jgi:hypothetical protein